VRTRHLRFYVALGEEADAKLRGPEQGAWLSRLDSERDNLLLAHAWCDRAEGGAEQGLLLVAAVQRYWLPRGLLDQGYRVTVEALERAGAEGRSPARGAALFAAGRLASFMGRYAEARTFLEQSLGVAREAGDDGRAAWTLRLLGIAT